MDEEELQEPSQSGRPYRDNEDPADLIELDDEDGGDAVAPDFVYDEDEPNLVPLLMRHEKGKKALEQISELVKRCKQEGQDGSAEYRDRFARDWSLLTGDLPPKEPPHEHSANIHYPILLKHILRVMPQTWEELFGDWSEPLEFETLSGDPVSEAAAKTRTMHTNWQFQEGIPDFQRQMARGLMLFWHGGDVTAESYFDDFTQTNKHDVVTCDEFFVPYVYVSTQPDYSDCPWRVRMRRMYRHELQARRGEWHDVKKVLAKEPPGWHSDGEARFREIMGDVQGQEESDAKDSNEYMIIQWDGWVSDEILPNQDRDRWCRAHVDETTGAILCLTIMEEPSPEEEARYAAQVEELDAYRAALEAFGQASERFAVIDEAASRVLPQMPEDDRLRQHLTANIEAMRPQMPIAPAWLPEPTEEEVPETDDGTAYLRWLGEVTPEPPLMKPIHMYSHAVNIEPIVGNLGLGHGRMLGDFNRAANIAAQQFSDAATAANIPRAWIDKNAEVERPDIVYQPGSYERIQPAPGKSVKESLEQMRADMANPQLLELVQLMDKSAEDVAQSPEVLAGKGNKSGDTFRGMTTRLEQATKQLSMPTSRFAAFYKQIARNNSRLNAMFLPDESTIRARDVLLQQRVPITVRREMYEQPADIVVKADLRFISRAERVKEADELLQFPLHIPVLAQNPTFLYRALMNSLRARKAYDLMRTLGPEPPQSPMPFGINPMMPPLGQAQPPQQPQGNPQQPQPGRRPLRRPGQPRPANAPPPQRRPGG